MASAGLGIELILTCLLLALVALLIISVIKLALHVDQLRKTTAVLERQNDYSNPVNLIEIGKEEPKTPPPRPISGTRPWMTESMESVVVVPSRPESPKDVFRKDECLFVVNTPSCETFEMPTVKTSL